MKRGHVKGFYLLIQNYKQNLSQKLAALASSLAASLKNINLNKAKYFLYLNRTILIFRLIIKSDLQKAVESQMKPLKTNNINFKQQLLINKFIGDKFQNLGVIGGGSYGQVYKVRHKQTKKIYAVKIYKKIFTNRIMALRTLRQVTILRRINHQRIIKIYDILPPEDLQNFDSIGVLLQYLPFDLKRLCEKNKFLKDQHIPKIIYQILVALKYLNQAKILHRDLKPENILSDNDYNIKICDFGLARPEPSEHKLFTDLSQIQIQKTTNQATNTVLDSSSSLSPSLPIKPSKLMTCHVVSRWYRAPQLILMQTKYDSSIQMWSVGCILGQLICQHENNKQIGANKQRKALFQGKACFPLSPPKKQYVKLYKVQNGFPHSEDDQISKILQIIGSPTQQQVSFIQEALAANYIKSLPKYQKRKASDIFTYCKPEWQDFLDRALVFDPRKRISIDQAINHPLFDSIRNKEDFTFKTQQDFDLSLPSDMPIEAIKQKLKQQIMYYQNGTVMQQEK